jgi:hypothetical protein
MRQLGEPPAQQAIDFVVRKTIAYLLQPRRIIQGKVRPVFSQRRLTVR